MLRLILVSFVHEILWVIDFFMIYFCILIIVWLNKFVKNKLLYCNYIKNKWAIA